MKQKILLAISEMIKNKGIKPDTIKMNPADLYKLKIDRYDSGELQNERILTIFGLIIIETTKIEEGKALIYNELIDMEIDL